MQTTNDRLLKRIPPDWENLNDGPRRGVHCREDSSDDECGVFPTILSAVNHARYLRGWRPVNYAE